jgi:beta-glucanase (GH16 family)
VDGKHASSHRSTDVDPGQWVFDGKPFFLLLNLAVGGNYPGSPDRDTQFPQTMLIDYVRVYQLATPAVNIKSEITSTVTSTPTPLFKTLSGVTSIPTNSANITLFAK